MPSQQHLQHGNFATSLVAHDRPAPTPPPLSALHQRTIALDLRPGHAEVLLGRGFYELDPQLGAVLRVPLLQSDACEFLIVERSWKGEILSGQAHGCDYLI